MEKKRKKWIRDGTRNLIQERKNIKAKMNEMREQEEHGKLGAEYGKLNREIKKSAKKDKVTWTNKLAQEAEEAAATNTMRELYKTTKILTNKSYNPNHHYTTNKNNSLEHLKNKRNDGRNITQNDLTKNVWKQRQQT